jgi:hypothetical protein
MSSLRKAAAELRPLLLIAACVAPCQAQSGDTLRNWFDDPFFQISSAIADCPLPAGPFVDERERRVQAHRRAEKGTTCWLAQDKACERPNAYAYDQDIAAAFRAALRERQPFPHTTLWVTVQGRVVYIEGCAAQRRATAELEAFARSLPHVQQAMAIVRTDPSAAAPYRLRRAPR